MFGRTLALGAFLLGAEAYGQASIRGIMLRAEAGSGIFGYEATGRVGTLHAGWMDLKDHAYLLQWNDEAAAVFGLLAYEHPYHPLFGVAAQAQEEGGLRLRPSLPWSPYVGLRATVLGSAVVQSGVALNGGSRANNEGDLAGLLVSGQVALGGGLSLLETGQSLVIQGDLLVEGDSSQSNAPARAFFGGALHARWNVAASTMLAGELSYAVTPASTNDPLQTWSRTNRWVIAGAALHRVSERWFWGGALHVQREGTRLLYQGSLAYNTATPVDSRLSLVLGYSL